MKMRNTCKRLCDGKRIPSAGPMDIKPGKPAVFSFLFLPAILLFSLSVYAQQQSASPSPWVPDLPGGKYKNPVIFADYSDPDICRKGDDYYLVSSSFDAVPGLPVLHSKDLVNWTIIGHALTRLTPYARYAKNQHGNGVWAPAIRYHEGAFYIYYPDPDYGIYMVKAADPAGPWSVPVLVEAGKGLEDPCPLWDDNGKAYLIHAFAGSRAGIRNVLVMHEMNAEGTRLLNNGHGVIVYDGHGIDPDVEGPKLYKRNGYYYIFAPAGGFSEGWQIVLRARNIYGPYERRKVMQQGNSGIAGPHQGGWVETPGGQSWFLHFAKPSVYGRLVYLEPMKWVAGWPVIGVDKDHDGIGEPVDSWWKPDVGKRYPPATPQTSDEFNSSRLGLQWQWQANPQSTWAFHSPAGFLRLYAVPLSGNYRNYWNVPNVLMQKFPAETFAATVKLHFHPLQEGDKAGLIVMGKRYAYISVEEKGGDLQTAYTTCAHADKGDPEQTRLTGQVSDSTLYFRVVVDSGGVCHFSYSTDGTYFRAAGGPFKASEGKWIGAKLGLFCSSARKINDAGYANFDWFRVRAKNPVHP